MVSLLKGPGMDGISAQPDNRGFNPTVDQLVDILFGSLKLVFPHPSARL